MKLNFDIREHTFHRRGMAGRIVLSVSVLKLVV